MCQRFVVLRQPLISCGDVVYFLGGSTLPGVLNGCLLIGPCHDDCACVSGTYYSSCQRDLTCQTIDGGGMFSSVSSETPEFKTGR